MNALTEIKEPQDGFVIELEQSLLGILLQGQGLQRVRSFLREDHFAEDAHKLLYRAICDAFDQTGSTAATLVLKLVPDDLDEGMKSRAGVGVRQYVARLISGCIHTVAGIEKAAQAVVEQWARLRLAEMHEVSAEAARQPQASVKALLKSAGSTLEEINTGLQRTRSRSTRMTAAQAGVAAIEAAKEAKANGGGLTGVTWGYADVDRLTGGMQRKDLILCGARPSMGKSTLMMSTALCAARKGFGVGILSLEMDASKLMARGLSDLTFSTHHPVEYADIIRGNLDDLSISSIENAQRHLDKYPIEIDETPVNTFDIRMKIEGMMERFERSGWPRLDCLMIDHLGFVQPGEHYKGNRNNEVGEITRALKDMAKEYDIPVLLLSQLSRQSTQRDNKRPILSDLRDSGNIEQDADVVVFLHREAYYLERLEESDTEKQIANQARLDACRHQMEFIIAKQRNGPVVPVNLFCDMAYSAVRNAERYR